MRRIWLPATALSLLSVAFAADPDAGKIVVYRDSYGVPHIYAPTVEEGAYAVGYTQAEDRLEELLKNILRGTGEMAAAFALYPTQMTDLMAVADAGLIMPPKSTWFEPKLADGMVSHVLD